VKQKKRVLPQWLANVNYLIMLRFISRVATWVPVIVCIGRD
jgi:hypothetical protein